MKILPAEKAEDGKERDIISCPSCKKDLDKQLVVMRKYVCYECGYYFRVRAKNRVRMVADEGSFSAWFEEESTKNPLDFPGYEDKIVEVKEKTGLTEGVLIGDCTIGGVKTVLGVIDSRFLMGSMGHVVGERITAAVERATERKLPVILFCCSGGARMQEGIVSLMQMAKTSGAFKKHSQAGLLYVPVLTDPTTGGVTASFAMLGDIILAEPKALIGFAGPRVIEQTIGQKLPEGFQRAEFQLEHGFVDAIVTRDQLKGTLEKILKFHSITTENGTTDVVVNKETTDVVANSEKTAELQYAHFDPAHDNDRLDATELMKERAAKAPFMKVWDKVTAARQVTRLGAEDYIDCIFDSFTELHGDRYFRDDPAILGGIASLDGQPVTVIGVNKGKDAASCIAHNYGMPSPEGYRKAIRLMKQAEKFNRPIITFVNTSGAYPGLEAEENGQGEAIARNLYEMSGLTVPLLAIMIGEGGSGGALALAMGNEVWMLENATYSILSPEGFASILWKDGSRAEEAAGVMKITASELKSLGIVEQIIPEYGMADAPALTSISHYLKKLMKEFLKKESALSKEEIVAQRYERFRKF